MLLCLDWKIYDIKYSICVDYHIAHRKYTVHAEKFGAVAIWGDGVGKPITPGVPDPRPDISGAGEGLGHDHRIRVRTPEGEHPALAFA